MRTVNVGAAEPWATAAPGTTASAVRRMRKTRARRRNDMEGTPEAVGGVRSLSAAAGEGVQIDGDLEGDQANRRRAGPPVSVLGAGVASPGARSLRHRDHGPTG